MNYERPEFDSHGQKIWIPGDLRIYLCTNFTHCAPKTPVKDFLKHCMKFSKTGFMRKLVILSTSSQIISL